MAQDCFSGPRMAAPVHSERYETQGPRILIGVYEPPGWGGASTVAYRLHQRLLERGQTSGLVLLLDPEHLDFYRLKLGPEFANPHRLESVFTAPLVVSKVAEVARSWSPDVLVAVGWLAANALKRAAPELPCVLRADGLGQARYWLEKALLSWPAGPPVKTAVDLIRLLSSKYADLRLPVHGGEPNAVERSDYILAPSPLIRDLFLRFFPVSEGKMAQQPLWVAPLCRAEAETFAAMHRPLGERSVDVLFSASLWSRWEKNFALIPPTLRLLPSDCRVHVAGDLSLRQRKALGPRVVAHGLLSRSEHYELLGKSRCVAVPSVFDAAPGLIFEAASMGCETVSSPNCGNFEVCAPDAQVRDLEPDSFARAILASLGSGRPRPEQRLEPFCAHDFTTEILEVCEALL